jgi:hypothetical protein
VATPGIPNGTPSRPEYPFPVTGDRPNEMPDVLCPNCAAEFAVVWHVTVGTNPQGYTPVFGKAPVAVEAGRCDSCNISFERIDGGAWRRQAHG